jgi:putative PIN family toxin of toxin-antitoxin system
VTVVLDTNVVIAAIVSNGLCRELVHRTIRQRVLATSEALLRELDATLRDKFAVTPAVAAFIDLFRASIRVVDPKPLPERVCRDTSDDVVLATAVAAAADVIVTGDQDLLVLGSHAGIDIVSPRAFLERLDRILERDK